MPAEATQVRDPVADPALLTHWLVVGSLTLPGEPWNVRSARTFVAQTIGARHPRADEAVLLTSELVTNAVTHSRSRLPGGTVKVVIAAKASVLLISVTDDGSDSTVPVIRRREDGEHGNGLLLAATIADVWGYMDQASRMIVWFKLGSRGAPGRHPASAGPISRASQHAERGSSHPSASPAAALTTGQAFPGNRTPRAACAQGSVGTRLAGTPT